MKATIAVIWYLDPHFQRNQKQSNKFGLSKKSDVHMEAWKNTNQGYVIIAECSSGVNIIGKHIILL